MNSIYLAIIHYPVYNNRGEVVATAVTNLDIHDLGRLAVTFGCGGLYVVTPLELQKKLVTRLVRHWREGRGSEWNLSRRDAFERVELAGSLEDARARIKGSCGEDPGVIATTAREMDGAVTFADMRRTLKEDPGAWLIMFGTGWGLTGEFMRNEADYILEPIRGKGEYNHLSVRCAAGIILDRLFRD